MFDKFRDWLWPPEQPAAPEPEVQTEPSSYFPMPKFYMFNETGNILLCSSDRSIQGFDQDIKDAFTDVSVFFAAMCKALHTTINPATGKRFSLYNYQAIKNILLQSGMFVQTNVEQAVFECSGVGESLGKELLQNVLNRNFADSSLGFTRGMFNGMSYQQAQQNGVKEKDYGDKETKIKQCRGGNIIFVCEMLHGLPLTSVVLMAVEPLSGKEKSQSQLNKVDFDKDEDAQDIYQLGGMTEKGYQAKGKIRKWLYKKRTYLFMPPRLLKHTVSSLNDADFTEMDDLVEALSSKLVSSLEKDKVTVENKPTSTD